MHCAGMSSGCSGGPLLVAGREASNVRVGRALTRKGCRHVRPGAPVARTLPVRPLPLFCQLERGPFRLGTNAGRAFPACARCMWGLPHSARAPCSPTLERNTHDMNTARSGPLR